MAVLIGISFIMIIIGWSYIGMIIAESESEER